MFDLFQAIDAKTIKDVMMKYVYDKCPAVAAVGMYISFFTRATKIGLHAGFI